MKTGARCTHNRNAGEGNPSSLDEARSKVYFISDILRLLPAHSHFILPSKGKRIMWGFPVTYPSFPQSLTHLNTTVSVNGGIFFTWFLVYLPKTS